MTVKSESDFEILLKIGSDFWYMTEFSGGEQSHDTESYPLGDRYAMGYIKGMPVISEITVRCPYDNTIHDPLSKRLQKVCDDEQIMIQVTPMRVCPEYAPDGEPTVYSGLSVTKIGRPQPNRGNSGTMLIEFSFNVASMEVGGTATAA